MSDSSFKFERVVVSGNEYKLDVNIGADMLGTMLSKKVLPLYEKELDYMLCGFQENGVEFMMNGKMGVVRNDEALNGSLVAGKSVVDHETVLFAGVLGRTLSGRPGIRDESNLLRTQISVAPYSVDSAKMENAKHYRHLAT
ncbi:hypothetical protein Tco_0896250 [Tanacetum coccineum]